ncbi:MAG: aromatic aminobenezylarsenical efflux permease ArsG family transporter [Thermoguttaceae bacterium]
MLAYLLYVGAALYLGILTSISPCPLATNIAAISYIGRKVDNSRAVIHAGLLYTLGRCLLYLALATLLTTTAMSIPAVSIFLQSSMHIVLGPVFLILGMFLVGLITISSGGTMMTEGMQKRVDAMGIWGALLLGVLFAVSFCPTSAAWFFGLLALTMGSEAGAITAVLEKVGIALPEASIPGGSLVLPLVYGIGTALPVLVVATLLAYSAKAVGKTYNVLSRIEWWARMATGWLFIVVGIWFTLIYVFEVS